MFASSLPRLADACVWVCCTVVTQVMHHDSSWCHLVDDHGTNGIAQDLVRCAELHLGNMQMTSGWVVGALASAMLLYMRMPHVLSQSFTYMLTQVLDGPSAARWLSLVPVVGGGTKQAPQQARAASLLARDSVKQMRCWTLYAP